MIVFVFLIGRSVLGFWIKCGLLDMCWLNLFYLRDDNVFVNVFVDDVCKNVFNFVENKVRL